MTETLTDRLAAIVGAAHVSTDPDVLDGRSVDHTGRYRGHASALVRPGRPRRSPRCCGPAATPARYVTVQGGRTSLVAGTVPEHDDVLLSTERLTDIGEVDAVERRIRVGAGATLADVQRAATKPRVWCSASTSPRATPPPSAAWRRRTRAGCAPCATATWASRSSAWTWCCPTARSCTGTARFGRTTPDTTWRRCSSAPRARSASSPGWICGCTPHRRTG